MRTVLRSGVLVVATTAIVLAGCSSDTNYGSSGGNSTATTQDNTEAVADGATISNFSFSSTGTLKAGVPFTVTNADGVTHTFTEPAGAFDVKVPGGGSAQVTVAAAGTYTVVCKIHTTMKGTITVV